ncbi:MAG TPA: SDR family oxidoreductase [Polyangiaceae bacterium]|jgi:NAD(P)-dependent dehydrogenase (short-subunit alcohol dehydrogenase family)
MGEKKRWGGSVAFVTGAASGIGRAISEEAARRGAEVVMADRQASLAEEAAKAIVRNGGKATACELDVCDFDAFTRIVNATVKRTGRVDYLFNNAGIAVGGEVASYTRADWDDVFDVNLRGVAYGIQAAYPHMITQGGGHIVNTASVAGLVPSGEAASYTATKHAVVGLSKALRVEAARYGVRVSVLCPGAIRTPILTGGKYGRMKMPGVTSQQVMEQWERVWPIEPGVLARKTLDAVEKNAAIIVIPGWWKVLWYLDRFSPGLSMALSRKMLEDLRKTWGVPEGGKLAARTEEERVKEEMAARTNGPTRGVS